MLLGQRTFGTVISIGGHVSYLHLNAIAGGSDCIALHYARMALLSDTRHLIFILFLVQWL